MTQPRLWTDEEVTQLLELVHEAGAIQERQRIADAAVEIEECWTNQARSRREQVIANRIASFAPTDPDWLERSAQRHRDHDQVNIDIGKRLGPAHTTWRQVHAMVTASVWERIFWDLSSATQEQHADIAPASWGGRLQHLGVAA